MHRVSYLPRRARPRLDPLEARDVPATPNVLVSFTVGSDTETVGEFTQTGELVKSAAVPPNGGLDEGSPNARDIDVTTNGKWVVYNGTFSPTLATYTSGTGAFTQLPFPGWSTVNNVSYGGLSVAGRFAFASDMNTAGGTEKGIVQFDLIEGTAIRFATDHDYTDLNVGLDGRLYALRGEAGPIDVFDPSSTAPLRSFYPGGGAASTIPQLRGLAANALGEVFVVTWDEDVYRLASTGEVLGSYHMTGPPGGGGSFGDTFDIDLSNDGSRLVIGSQFGHVVQMAADFTDVSYFQVGDAPVFVTFKEPAPPPPVIPLIRVNDASVVEGHTGTRTLTFTVRLSARTILPVRVDYATQDATATAGEDYDAASGTLSFAPGETVKTVAVTVRGDHDYEPDEVFQLVLSGAFNGTLDDAIGLGTIKTDDRVPVARAGADRAAKEGSLVTFTAAGSFDPDKDPVTFEWDFGDGQTGTGFRVKHAFADQGTYTVKLTVKDPFGGEATDEVLVTVRNVAPRGRVTGPSVSVPGWDRPFTFTGTDPGSIDLAQLEYRIDWGDGQTHTATAGLSLTLAHAYAAPGVYTVRFQLVDKDGALSPEYVKRVTVAPTVVEAGIRFVPGTDGDDTIQVAAANAAGTVVTVTVNGQPAGTWGGAGFGILGLGGNDTITTTGPVNRRLLVFGGAGNDTISVASVTGPTVLIGGIGDDTLQGGDGRDILLGGDGLDFLDGRGEDDILIGGGLSFEADLTRLKAVSTEWAKPTAYEMRRDRLLGLGDGGLNAATVLGDAVVDTATGGAGRDWFFNSAAVPDSLTDPAADETVTVL